ncbi:MAG: fumarylacetoacetate hydrolase family protein, partial [Burkholderiales bacterium]|nr:fumarylacetoacetate hydrolase family protein [Burkholderiales bacterium]
MKLATLKDGSRDGMLAVVSRDLKTAHLAVGIAPTLQRALDDWGFIAPQLEDLSIALNSGRAKRPFEFVPANCMAPLPRTHQWADGSVYQQHVELLTRAVHGKLPPNLWREPMIYQGGGDDFVGPCDAPVFAEEHWGIDFEPELGVVLGDTPMQTRRDEALEHVRLLVLINDWSLRNLIPGELSKGFGFFQSKPATAFAPLAVTPDELGEAWADGLARIGVAVDWNGVRFMSANAGVGARFSFADLIAHAAKTRNLRAGTIVGSGTVSNEGNVGCIAELRARESLDEAAGGKPRTEYMKFGDRVRIDAFDASGASIFGAIDQQVASLRRRRAMPGAGTADDGETGAAAPAAGPDAEAVPEAAAVEPAEAAAVEPTEAAAVEPTEAAAV